MSTCSNNVYYIYTKAQTNIDCSNQILLRFLSELSEYSFDHQKQFNCAKNDYFSLFVLTVDYYLTYCCYNEYKLP